MNNSLIVSFDKEKKNSKEKEQWQKLYLGLLFLIPIACTNSMKNSRDLTWLSPSSNQR